MTETSWQSLVTLRPERARALRALSPDLFAGHARAAHRLVWGLFGDDAERRRDFLFRTVADRPPQFVDRSARPPADPFDLWTIDCRPFAPRLTAGARFRFRAVVVPTVQRKEAGRLRGRRRSVVLDLPKDLAAEERRETAETAALAWLAAHASTRGFRPEGADVIDLRRVAIPRDDGPPIFLGTATIAGRLSVTDPDTFAALLRDGLGPNRAFGYGLVELAPDGPEPVL